MASASFSNGHEEGYEQPPVEDHFRNHPHPNLVRACAATTRKLGLTFQGDTLDNFRFALWAAVQRFNKRPGPAYDDSIQDAVMTAQREFLKALAGDRLHTTILEAVKSIPPRRKEEIFAAVAAALEPRATGRPAEDLTRALDPSSWDIEGVPARTGIERALRLSAFVSGMLCQERAIKSFEPEAESTGGGVGASPWGWSSQACSDVRSHSSYSRPPIAPMLRLSSLITSHFGIGTLR